MILSATLQIIGLKYVNGLILEMGIENSLPFTPTWQIQGSPGLFTKHQILSISSKRELSAFPFSIKFFHIAYTAASQP